MTARARTQVAIVGAGPAGLTLSFLLARHGIESVILEKHSREYVESRVRAGVLEHQTVQLLRELELADRLEREGEEHAGIYLRFNRRDHRIAFDELTGGKTIWLYGQQQVVKDLIAARIDRGGEIRFEAECVGFEDLESDTPRVRYVQDGEERQLEADVIAGCDGGHGVCRGCVPDEAMHTYAHQYPFAWLGILAEVAPSTDELIYANHERGFALHSLRSRTLSRLYLQVAPDEDLEEWPDDRIWSELHRRLETDDDWELQEGPVLEKIHTVLSGTVVEPMRYGRMFLAGDAAHIVPATGAKGLNAAVADVQVLAEGLRRFFGDGSENLLEAYSDICLRRMWKVQNFSWWMTEMLHRFPTDDGFLHRVQLGRLDRVASSQEAATNLAQNYVGLPVEL